MQKSFWYLVAWVWRNGLPVPAPISKAPGDMRLTSGYNTTPTNVPRIEITDSFRTLGVYISPSGSQQKQLKILRQYSDRYFINVSTSTLTPDEAFSSYMQYLRPQPIYPLPCCSLTHQQCKQIQAPALAALLPKLHMNCHTPHVIVFGEQKYGGLELPDLYTDQGYGQLKLLVAHLKMKDEIGDLILIAISHLQIHIGSATPFFALPYPAYNKWIPNSWLTSIWKHTHQLTIVVDVKKHWTLGLARQHDKFIMDEILTYNFSSQQLILINNCCLYLQVILISDITTADGKFILSSVQKGQRPKDRPSNLYWPRQEKPPAQAWNLWNTALSHISTRHKLHQSLGSWLKVLHQNI
jgi:hypothetical protein